MQQQNSKVARLLAQINAEYKAAQLGLSGLAQGARHNFITKRMEAIGTLHMLLRGLVGDEAMEMIVDKLEDDQGAQEDPELAAIADQLQETASYAINPEFKYELHARLLQQYRLEISR